MVVVMGIMHKLDSKGPSIRVWILGSKSSDLIHFTVGSAVVVVEDVVEDVVLVVVGTIAIG